MRNPNSALDQAHNRDQLDKATKSLPDLPAPILPEVDAFLTRTVLTRWIRPDDLLKKLFTDPFKGPEADEFAKVGATRLKEKQGRQILMCSYENSWGQGGGLFQIARKLPAEFNRLAGGELTRAIPDVMYRLSPLHANLPSSLPKSVLDTARSMAKSESPVSSQDLRVLIDSPITEILEQVAVQYDRDGNPVAYICYLGTCNVPFGSPSDDGVRPLYSTDIYRAFDVAGGDDWILFGNDSFFQGDRSPYEYHKIPKGREGVEDNLRHDALFASKAAPYVAATLGFSSPLFNVQDWQFVSVALCAKEACLAGVLPQAAVVLTMHNVYDQKFPTEELHKITERIDDARWPMLSDTGTRNTLLTRMIPLLDAPVSAVSADLIHDVINIPACFGASTELVTLLKEFGAVGIFNGTYVQVPRNELVNSAIKDVRSGEFNSILRLKSLQRTNMLTHLSTFLREQRETKTSNQECPILGHLREEKNGKGLSALDPSVPVFFTMGRFDPDQKGQDLFLEALSRLPKEVDARFIVGAAGISKIKSPEFYAHAEDIVAKSEGRVIVVSTFFTGQVRENLQKGPNFFVMPSIYEPTGLVTEVNAQLTPVIAHATGGLRRLVAHYSLLTKTGSGLHFGVEKEYSTKFDRQWAGIRGTLPEERLKVPLYNQLANELACTLKGATELFAQHPQHYASMLANLPAHVTKFAWGPSIYQYWDLFDTACSDY